MQEVTLKVALDEYKKIFMAYRNFADRTRVEYQNDIEGFIGFLERSGITLVRGLGVPIVERYIATLEQKGYSSLTRKRKTVTIRSFLSFLYQDGYIKNNIAKMIVLPFTENRTPEILTQTECNRLHLACAGNSRDRAIIELLLQTGIKLSELIDLTFDDLEFEEANENVSGHIRIVGSRGKKDRFIPLNNVVYQAIRSYLLERNGVTNKALFLNRFGEPVGERGVQKMLRKYLKRAGIGRASIHTLRHTFGAQHIAKGTELKTVVDLMGLKDKRSTLFYQTLAREVISRN